MALRTAEEYKNSLIDDRVIWYRGARVDNICEHPELSAGRHDRLWEDQLCER